jgi:hypothetical protein
MQQFRKVRFSWSYQTPSVDWEKLAERIVALR